MTMNIMPTRVEEQLSRVDRTRSLAVGVSAGLVALWSIYRVLWLVYAAATFSSVGWSPVSLVFPVVLWSAIAAGAGLVAAAFLIRYAKKP
jgi:hypothetical protein